MITPLSSFERTLLDYIYGTISAQQASETMRSLEYMLTADGVRFIVRNTYWTLYFRAIRVNGICISMQRVLDELMDIYSNVVVAGNCMLCSIEVSDCADIIIDLQLPGGDLEYLIFPAEFKQTFVGDGMIHSINGLETRHNPFNHTLNYPP
jgi:hypothetical protein